MRREGEAKEEAQRLPSGASNPQARREGRGLEEREPAARDRASLSPRHGEGDDDERLDPLGRALALPLSLRLEPAAPAPAAAAAAPAAPAAPSLDRLVERFLKRFAMSSSRGRGVAHLELGDGALGGGRITIEAEGAEVRVVVEGASGEEAERWASALEGRLRGRGLEASVELR